MKNTKLLKTLALTIFLTACSGQSAPADNPVSEETIAQALDGEVTHDEVQTADGNQTTTAEKTTNADPDAIDYEKWRRMITDIGEFSPTLVKNLTDEQIDELVTNARERSEETGYWDVKDFVFQDLGKMYPELSTKFPLDSIENRYNETAAEEGDYLGKFDYERLLMVDEGWPSYDIWALDDKAVQDAFHQAYEEDEELMYEDYVTRAAEILFGEDEEEDTADEEDTATANRASDNTSKKTTIRRYGSSQVDYDAIKSALVQYYEFSPSSVNQMTNEDIDIAYTRAMTRMEENGFGDIGLIFEELGKMFPGSSTMYPGESAE